MVNVVWSALFGLREDDFELLSRSKVFDVSCTDDVALLCDDTGNSTPVGFLED